MLPCNETCVCEDCIEITIQSSPRKSILLENNNFGDIDTNDHYGFLRLIECHRTFRYVRFVIALHNVITIFLFRVADKRRLDVVM